MITAAEFQMARGKFLADIAGGLWQAVPVMAADFDLAEQLLVRHGLVHDMRTLDAIQLAVALGLNASVPLAAFVCADNGLCRVAAAEGLPVINPEVP